MKNHQIDLFELRECAARFMILLFILLTMCVPPAQAAYCSLRDPVVAINALYPNATNHRSIIRPITRETRSHLAERLPFTLHFNELGQHTLYVVQQQHVPVGFVHARSELSEWGLIEIAWAISSNMEVEGLYFQRCRSPACNSALQQRLLKDLKGKAYEKIMQMLNSDGTALTSEMSNRYLHNTDLAFSVVRSALKTLVATEHAWQGDIAEIRRLQTVIGWMSDHKLVKPQSLGTVALEKVDRHKGTESGYIENKSIEVFHVLLAGKKVARYINARWRMRNQMGDFSWLFSASGVVLGIDSNDPLPDESMAVAFKQLMGKDLSSSKNCATASEMLGNELYTNAFGIGD